MITVQVLGALKSGTAKLVAKKAANGPPFLRLGCKLRRWRFSTHNHIRSTRNSRRNSRRIPDRRRLASLQTNRLEYLVRIRSRIHRSRSHHSHHSRSRRSLCGIHDHIRLYSRRPQNERHLRESRLRLGRHEIHLRRSHHHESHRLRGNLHPHHVHRLLHARRQRPAQGTLPQVPLPGRQLLLIDIS